MGKHSFWTASFPWLAKSLPKRLMKDQPKISPSFKRILTLSVSNKFVASIPTEILAYKQREKVLKVNAAYVEQHYQSTGVEAI